MHRPSGLLQSINVCILCCLGCLLFFLTEPSLAASKGQEKNVPMASGEAVANTEDSEKPDQVASAKGLAKMVLMYPDLMTPEGQSKIIRSLKWTLYEVRDKTAKDAPVSWAWALWLGEPNDKSLAGNPWRSSTRTMQNTFRRLPDILAVVTNNLQFVLDKFADPNLTVFVLPRNAESRKESKEVLLEALDRVEREKHLLHAFVDESEVLGVCTGVSTIYLLAGRKAQHFDTIVDHLMNIKETTSFLNEALLAEKRESQDTKLITGKLKCNDSVVAHSKPLNKRLVIELVPMPFVYTVKARERQGQASSRGANKHVRWMEQIAMLGHERWLSLTSSLTEWFKKTSPLKDFLKAVKRRNHMDDLSEKDFSGLGDTCDHIEGLVEEIKQGPEGAYDIYGTHSIPTHKNTYGTVSKPDEIYGTVLKHEDTYGTAQKPGTQPRRSASFSKK